MDIKQHCPGCVGIIRRKHLSLGQVPHQPGVHSAEQKLSVLCHLARALHVLQNPADFRCGKISVRNQSRPFPDHFVKTVLFERVDLIRCPPALPYNRRINRFSGLFRKTDRRLTLIRNANCRNIVRLRADLPHRLDRYGKLGRPDFHRIVLYPARLGIILCKLFLRNRAYLSAPVKQNTTGTRRSLIQCHDVLLRFLHTHTPCIVFLHLSCLYLWTCKLQQSCFYRKKTPPPKFFFL